MYIVVIFFLMIRRPPRSTRTYTLFPTRRSSDLQIETFFFSLGLGITRQHDPELLTIVRDYADPRRGDLIVAPIFTFKSDCVIRSEEHTSELQSLMRISYAVFCLKKTNVLTNRNPTLYSQKCIQDTKLTTL